MTKSLMGTGQNDTCQNLAQVVSHAPTPIAVATDCAPLTKARELVSRLTQKISARLINEAQLSIDLRRYSEGEKICRMILAKDVDHLRALAALDHSLSGNGRWHEVVAIRRRIHALRPHDADTAVRVGLAFARTGDIDRAEGFYLLATGLEPMNAEPIFQLAQLAYWHREPQAAIGLLQEAIAVSPGHADAHHLLGVIHNDLGNYDASLRAFAACLDARPWHQRAFDFLIHIEGTQDRSANWRRHLDTLEGKESKTVDEWAFLTTAQLALGNPSAALARAEQAIEACGDQSNLLRLRAHCSRLADHHDQALQQIESLLKAAPHYFPAFDEYIHVLCARGEFKAAADFVASNKFYFESVEFMERASGLLREVYLGAKQFREAFSTFRFSPSSHTLCRCIPPTKLAMSLSALAEGENALVIAGFGIGDEIAWCHMYPAIAAKMKDVAFSCEPRLLSLLERSFPELRFIPTHRSMGLVPHVDPGAAMGYSSVPSLSLASIVDALGWNAIKNADRVALNMNLLADLFCRPDRLPRSKGYLLPDPERVNYWKDRLDSLPGLKVGFAWTSLRITHHRRVHLTELDDWHELLRVRGVTFVCLDPAATPEAIASASLSSGAQIVLLGDIDLRSDIDDVAALLKALDLVICIANSVAELAGAVGASTWTLARSRSLDWRIADDGETDLLHASKKYVTALPQSDIKSLMSLVATRLRRWVEETSPGIRRSSRASADDAQHR